MYTAYISCYLPTDKLQRVIIMLHVKQVSLMQPRTSSIVGTDVSYLEIRA